VAEGPHDFACSLGAIIGPGGLAGAFTWPREPRNRNVALSPSNWLHRRELIGAVGEWNESLLTAQDRDFAQRVLAKRATVGLHQDLSVLKFPSMLWHTYSLTSQFPQTPYVEAMQRDPHALRLELLTRLGTLAASQGCGPPTARDSLRGLLRAVPRRVVEMYGESRWPLRWIQYRRWRRGAGLSARRC